MRPLFMTEAFPGTRKGNYHLLTASTMPDCVATAAIAMHKLGMCVTLGPHNRPIELDVDAGDKSRRLYVIGTFWKKQLEELAKRFATVHVYSFGDDVENPFPNVTVFRDVTHIGSAAWLMNLPTDRYETVDPDLLALINVRCFGEGDERVQAFFTGIYDHVRPALGEDMLTVFSRLVVGSVITIKTVTERGQSLLFNHRGIAAERVRKSAWLAPQVSIVEGTELINLTHSALRSAHLHAPYTVVWRADIIDSERLVLAISVRAWFSEAIYKLQEMREEKTLYLNEKYDIVKALLKVAGLISVDHIPCSATLFLHGIGEPGGSIKAAGTTVPFLEGWKLLMNRINSFNE